MASSGIPVDPRILQNLQLAKRACSDLGGAGEPIELWEAYILAQADPPGLTRELEKVAKLRGVGTVGADLQKKIADLRKGHVPLVEYLRQTLPVSVPLLADAKALDLALVFIMSTPPARDAVVRWFKNPSGSRDEANKVLKTMGRMVETYQQALKEADAAAPPPAPPKPPVPPDDVDRLLQERIAAQRKSRERSITEKRTKEQDDAAKAARAKADAAEAEEAERKRVLAELAKKSPEPVDEERLAREKASAERMARLEAQAAEAAARVAEAQRVRLQAEADAKAREKAEIDRLEQDQADYEHQAKEKSETDRAAK